MNIKGSGVNKTIIKLCDFAALFINNNSKKTGLFRAEPISNLIMSDLTLDENKENQNTDADSVYGRFGIYIEGANKFC